MMLFKPAFRMMAALGLFCFTLSVQKATGQECFKSKEVRGTLLRSCLAAQIVNNPTAAETFSRWLYKHFVHRRNLLSKGEKRNGNGQWPVDGQLLPSSIHVGQVTSLRGKTAVRQPSVEPTPGAAGDIVVEVNNIPNDALAGFLPGGSATCERQVVFEIERETAVDWKKVCDKWMYDNFRTGTSWMLALAGASYITDHEFVAHVFAGLGATCAAGMVTTQCIANAELRKAVCVGGRRVLKGAKAAGSAIGRACSSAVHACAMGDMSWVGTIYPARCPVPK